VRAGAPTVIGPTDGAGAIITKTSDQVRCNCDRTHVRDLHERFRPRPGAAVGEIAGVLNVVNAQLVALTADALASGAWTGPGIHSPAQWLAWQTGICPNVPATWSVSPVDGPTSHT
jgi:hypothetical protein